MPPAPFFCARPIFRCVLDSVLDSTGFLCENTKSGEGLRKNSRNRPVRVPARWPAASPGRV